jgi:predicted RNA-binding Zn-ribbon protein involved in translation (DUF1610 family)
MKNGYDCPTCGDTGIIKDYATQDVMGACPACGPVEIIEKDKDIDLFDKFCEEKGWMFKDRFKHRKEIERTLSFKFFAISEALKNMREAFAKKLKKLSIKLK